MAIHRDISIGLTYWYKNNMKIQIRQLNYIPLRIKMLK
jgi:hypothetical protein